MLKACSEGHADFAGMVLTNDAVEEDDTVSTVGASRQFLAEFGDFPVYVVFANGIVKIYDLRIFLLLPGHKEHPHQCAWKSTRFNSKKQSRRTSIHRLTHEQAPEDDHNVHQWSVRKSWLGWKSLWNCRNWGQFC